MRQTFDRTMLAALAAALLMSTPAALFGQATTPDAQAERRRVLVQQALDALFGGPTPQQNTSQRTSPTSATPAIPATTTSAPRPEAGRVSIQLGPDGRPQVVVSGAAAAGVATPQAWSQVVGNVQRIAADADYLSRVVQADLPRVPRDPGLLTSSVNLRNQAAQLSSLASRTTDLRDVGAAFGAYDAQWRKLDDELSRQRDLHPSVPAVAARLREAHKLVAAALPAPTPTAPQPQRFNMQQIYALSVALDKEIGALVEDLDIELENARGFEQILRDARTLQAESSRLTSAAKRGQPNETVTAFQQLDGAWRRVAQSLSKVTSRHVERSGQRVRLAHDALVSAFGGAVVNRMELAKLAVSMQHDVDEILHGVSLASVLTQTSPEQFLTEAKAWRQAVDALVDEAGRDGDVRPLIETAVLYDSRWQPIAWRLQTSASSEVQPVVQRLKQSFGAMREQLRIPDAHLADAAMELADALDDLATHLARDVYDDLRTSPSRNTYYAPASAFAQAVRAFRDNLYSEGMESTARQRYQDVSRRWEELSSVLRPLDRRQYAHLYTLIDRIPPQLAQIESALGLRYLAARPVR